MRNTKHLASRLLAGIFVHMDRFTTRPDREGFSVYDQWTGEIAVIAMTPQSGLSRDDAEHTAQLLNRRAVGGDRGILQ